MVGHDVRTISLGQEKEQLNAEVEQLGCDSRRLGIKEILNPQGQHELIKLVTNAGIMEYIVEFHQVRKEQNGAQDEPVDLPS